MLCRSQCLAVLAVAMLRQEFAYRSPRSCCDQRATGGVSEHCTQFLKLPVPIGSGADGMSGEEDDGDGVVLLVVEVKESSKGNSGIEEAWRKREGKCFRSGPNNSGRRLSNIKQQYTFHIAFSGFTLGTS
jgi:hypothetical protein